MNPDPLIALRLITTILIFSSFPRVLQAVLLVILAMQIKYVSEFAMHPKKVAFYVN